MAGRLDTNGTQWRARAASVSHVCAWCNSVLVDGRWVTGLAPAPDRAVTHTICPTCRAREFAASVAERMRAEERRGKELSRSSPSLRDLP